MKSVLVASTIILTTLCMTVPAAAQSTMPEMPRVLEVRVPSARIGDWFPAGTEIKGMTGHEFDRLVSAVRKASARNDAATSSRAVHVDHSARWEEGVLNGHSVFVLERGSGGKNVVPLEPWTPAVVPTNGKSAVISDASGRFFIQPGQARADGLVKADVAWQLRARPGSQGKAFNLALPAADTCSLSLDLPDGWEPDGPAGQRSGPTASEGGRAVWTFVGRSTPCALTVGPKTNDTMNPRAVRLAVEGPTRFDVDESTANWSLEWTVSGDRRADSRLLVEIDAGLSVLGVTGPAVEEYRVETGASGKSIVAARLSPRIVGPTTVAIKGLTAVPAEGPWIVPAARPVNAVWMGGRTSVRYDTNRVVSSVRPLAARRVAPAGKDPAEERRLEFDAERPGSVAEIVFRRPTVDVVADVTGELVIAGSSPRMRARVEWRAGRGRLFGLSVDLPRSWNADRLEFEGGTGVPTWHQEVRPDGQVRLHVLPPAEDLEDGNLVLKLLATAAVAGGRGPLALPRVRAVGVRTGDEVWVALAEPEVTLSPTHAKGLAWIDPEAAPVRPLGTSDVVAGTRHALAWRWVTEQGEATVERGRADAAARGHVETVITIGPERLSARAKVTVAAGDEPIRGVTLGFSEALDDPASWRVTDVATGIPVSGTVAAKGGGAQARGRGTWWSFALPQPRSGRLELDVTFDRPWEGRGKLPLPILPPSLRPSATVLVLAGRDVLPAFQARGGRSLDPAVVADSFAGDWPSGLEGPAGTAKGATRRAFAYSYDGPDASIEVTTEALAAVPATGVVSEALLSDTLSPGLTARRQRLSLKVAPDRATTLDLVLPAGARLERVQRDGVNVVPGVAGVSLSVPLAETGAVGPRPQVVIVLDYLVDGPLPSEGQPIRPLRPRLSMPCLSFLWEVIGPDGWTLVDWGPALTPTDPSTARPGPLEKILGGRLALAVPSWLPRRSLSAAAAITAEMWKDLDSRLQDASAGSAAGEVLLGDWLTRLDAGRWPIVVDRGALTRAGLGPRSRVTIARPATGQPFGSTNLWRTLGLQVMPLGRTLLVTTPSEAPTFGPGDGRSERRWTEALAEAASWGGDRTDRFVSVVRWRETTTIRNSEGDSGFAGNSGGVAWRLVGLGWPDDGVEIRYVDRNAQGWATGTVALATLVVGLLMGSRLGRWSAPALAALASAGLVSAVLAPPWRSGPAVGLAAGVLAIVQFRVGSRLPSLSRFTRREPRSTVSFRHATPVSRLSEPLLPLLIAAALLVHSPIALSQTKPADSAPAPVVAVIPYDGEPNVAREAQRVLLRLADFDRLRVLAETSTTSKPAACFATGVTHKVSWTGKTEVVVESSFSIETQGNGPSTWDFPIGMSRQITATIDGADVPVRIAPGGKIGSVTLFGRVGDGSDLCRLRLTRRLPVRPVGRGFVISLPVNAVAAARVDVREHPDGLDADIPGGRGRLLDQGGELGPSGLLGPVDRLEVRWFPPGVTLPESASGSVDALLLWDSLNAGDRVRARLTCRNPEGVSEARIALDSGTTVRESGLPATSFISYESSGTGQLWVARFDPPLPDGSTFDLDLWRPRGKPSGQTVSTTGAADRLPERVMPRIELPGFERTTALLAFRRPPGWEGRIAAAGAAEPINEETFVRAWGPLPQENLTLSGALRLPSLSTSGTLASVNAGPGNVRSLVVPTTRVSLAPGRISLTFEGALTSSEDSMEPVELAVPKGFQVDTVTADGLSDWVRPDGETIGLRFDGRPASVRKIAVKGWLPEVYDPLAPAPAKREVPLPRPRWVGMEQKPGTLTVVSPTRFQLLDRQSKPIPPRDIPAGTAVPGQPLIATYKVDATTSAGTLRWDVEPPRVSVFVRSQVTVNTDSADWVALLRYDVSGGALDVINLSVPAAWAPGASVRLEGVEHQQTGETRDGVTLWTLRPERPLWGSQRIVVRTRVPFPPGSSMDFPELRPRGWGEADTYLRLVNATRQPLSVAWASGVRPVATQAFQADDELVRGALKAATVSNYHVVRGDWSLKFARPGSTAGETGDGSTATVTRAELDCSVSDDGSALGVARCAVGTGGGAFLPVTLANGSAPLWATASGVAVRPLGAGPGRWLIPLPEGDAGPVAIAWRSASQPGTRQSVTLPSLGSAKVPAVVTVHDTTESEVASRNGGLNPVGLERVEIERAGWLATEIAGSLTTIDRSSRRDTERLVASLVRFELCLRQAERSAGSPSRAYQVRQAATRLRTRVDEALRNEFLGDYAKAAQVQVGLERPSAETAEMVAAETPAAIQYRPLGRPSAFLGELPAPGLRSPVFSRVSAMVSPGDEGGWAVVIGALGLMVIAALSLAPKRAFRLGLLMLPLALAVVAVGWGPGSLAAAGALTGFGWLARRD